MTESILSPLQLPRRWEVLTDRAEEAGVDPSDLVERAPLAEARIDQLLSRIQSGSGGVFEILLGKSGSGKTTFVKSLPRFFDNIFVISIDPGVDLNDLPQIIKRSDQEAKGKHKLVLIEKRDNPRQADIDGSRDYFISWLDFLRESEGNVVILWTMTDPNAAKEIAETAWDVGRDSICAHDSRGVFSFEGVGKSKYYDIADNTALNLSGDGLEAYGVSREVAAAFIDKSETISDFFQEVISASAASTTHFRSLIRERGQPRLWVLLHGDDRSAIGHTVGSLTQGSHWQVDLSRILDTIDDNHNTATYAKEWRKRRANAGQLLRALDARVFAIPPNVSVHAVRCFGDGVVKGPLKNKSGAKAPAAASLRSTPVYKELLIVLGKEASPSKASGKIADATIEEYKAIQALARNNDEKLNQAIGKLFEYTLQEDGLDVEVSIEKRSDLISGIQVDIGIRVGQAEFVCLEPTWRSKSGGDSGQNTLSEGHIKPYLLDKALKYIAAMDL
ncbi:hypothetical protein [Pseudooceanicola marinus]|uniref:hypothetical protein n=1 Tax=Pseudooceanicola marinus TaxID=396013 RepID=UPI001CD2047A|nr:hypothetical protein [Pseudooceanicola marinus]MCA1336884.1 hypothetical protein [Pseudooceanicola marinus]